MNIFTKKKRKEEGFTLIELIIVVGIIGFLMAIAIPRYTTSRLVAAQNATKANLHQLATALEVWYTENGATAFPANNAIAGALDDYIPKPPKTPYKDANGNANYYYNQVDAGTYAFWDPNTPTTGETNGGADKVYQIGPGGVITIVDKPAGNVGTALNW